MVESDHRPFESTLKKPLYEVPLRSQRMPINYVIMMKMLGTKMGERAIRTRHLSRAYLADNGMSLEGPLEVSVVKD